VIWWPSEIPTLQYGRYTLRPPAEKDVVAIFNACQDPLIPRFTTVPANYTMAHALDYVQRVPASIELKRELPFVIEFGVGDEKEFAGVISFHTISIENHRAEIGYWIHAPMRGKGISTIAAKMITGYGFETMGLKRIEAAVDLDNHASQKLLLSAGYVLEGVLKQRVPRANTPATLPRADGHAHRRRWPAVGGDHQPGERGGGRGGREAGPVPGGPSH
jgi:RimJ/RimL family protein N-acetyltransferase